MFEPTNPKLVFHHEKYTLKPIYLPLFVLVYWMLSQLPIPAYDSLTDVAKDPEDCTELITYITRENRTRIRQLHRVNGPLPLSTEVFSRHRDYKL